MTSSNIEWCDRSDWNPLRGCTRVSPGCGGPGPHGGCYAEAIAARFSDPGQPFHGFAERTKSGPRWTGKVELIEERLTAPLRWRKPARIFALSMSDLFHESVPDAWIDRIFAVMGLAPSHTFQILTKRAERMRDYMATPSRYHRVYDAACEITRAVHPGLVMGPPECNWPLRQCWLGVSVEDQRRADERIPVLLDTPAAVRWISAEPLLAPVDLCRGGFSLIDRVTSPTGKRSPGLDWVVVGGESGSGARPFCIGWGRTLVGQCATAGVPVFMKQIGAKPYPWAGKLRDRKGGDMTEFPPDLRIREYPKWTGKNGDG